MFHKIELALVVLLASTYSYAGGLLGDAINVIAPGIGTQLDKAHDQVKQSIPIYKQVEEGASAAVRHGSQQIIGEAGAPFLKNWILESRNDALRAGTGPMPPNIRAAFAGYFPVSFLDSVRYRSGQGHELSLQANSFRFGDRDAITLDHVIVFRNSNDANNNVYLWAHELGHVLQYQKWGMEDFTKRYLRDFNSVEQDAENVARQFWAWYQSPQRSVGSRQMPTIQQNGFPSGYGMQGCGCWGPNPPPSANEPKCASGTVRMNVCPGLCAPGHPLYSYVCS